MRSSARGARRYGSTLASRRLPWCVLFPHPHFPHSLTPLNSQIIAQYESSAHPEYHPDRLSRAFTFLDEVVSALALTSVDAQNADVCHYASAAAPVVAVQPDMRCACMPPGTPPRDADSVLPSTLPWDPSWGAREIRDEECRRVCWAALSLATSFRAECMALARADECQALSICDPANVRLPY